MPKFRIARKPLHQTIEPGIYWVKHIRSDRNTKWMRLTKKKAGAWFDAWADEHGNPFEMVGEFHFRGPIPDQHKLP